MEFLVGTVNCQGLARKRHLIKHILNSQNIQILSLTDTLCKTSPCFTGYTTFHSPKTPLTKGNGFLVRNGIPVSLHPFPPHITLLNLDCFAIDVHHENAIITLISYYKHPAQTLSDPLFNYFSSLPKAVLLGDLNARHTQFGDRITNREGRILSDFLIDLPIFRIINTNPTFVGHQGASIVDHILCTESQIQCFDDECFIGESITSDHVPLLVKTSLTNPIRPPPTTYTFRDFRKADWNLFQNHISINLPPVDEIPNDPEAIDQTALQISTLISNAAEIAIPLTTINTSFRPLPQNILAKIREKRRLYRLYVRTRDPQAKTEWNRLNALVRLMTTTHKQRAWMNTTSKLDYRDGHSFWQTFKVLTGQKTKTHSHLQVNDQIHHTAEQKAQAFKNHLSQIYTPPQNLRFNQAFERETTQITLPIFQNNHNPVPLDPNIPLLSPFTPHDIAHACQLGKNSAPGPDSISRHSLKHLPETIYPLLTKLLNACLQTTYFPSCWKTSNTILIPKPGKDPTKPDSYRPISLINVLGKLFEVLLKERLWDFLNTNQIIPPCQHGFRSEHSSQNALTYLLTTVTQALNLRQYSLAILLDVQKAFDKVWHEGLIRKLLNINLPIPIVKLIHSYLTDRTMRVKVGNSFSDPFTPRAGVPQGSILAPILYLILRLPKTPTSYPTSPPLR